MDRRKAIIGGCVVILLGVACAWAFGLFGGTDPAVAKLQEIGDQMAGKNLPDVLRNQLRDQFRDQMRSMTDEQRRAFFDTNRDQWQARSQQRMDELFSLPKGEQQKKLDQILKSASQSRNNQRPNGGNQNGTHGSGRSMTEAQREERSKRRLDGTTPKMRAQYAEFHRMLDQRAQQLGVKPPESWHRGKVI
jgi:hypothetical protein